jgi:hypothetical protein
MNLENKILKVIVACKKGYLFSTVQSTADV